MLRIIVLLVLLFTAPMAHALSDTEADSSATPQPPPRPVASAPT